MKIKQIIVLLTVLVFISQPVSAGFFTDFFNLITGRTTEEETPPEPPPEEPEPEPEPEIIPEEPEIPPEDPIPPVEEKPTPPTEPEIPPEDPIPPTEPEPIECPPEIAPLCPGQKTPCPHEENEYGCPVWDCSACEEPPLDCMPAPQFCPDGKTFCPSKKDEQGCTYYDCDACPKQRGVCTMEIISCPGGKTTCPSKRDENGCHIWNCDACPKEGECPVIEKYPPYCSDCKMECKNCCLCPQGTDEQGCPMWDCDACPESPEEECGPIALTMVCLGCIGPPGDCLCPKKTDERGCTVWDCDSCQDAWCPPIPTKQWCNAYTLCPKGITEKGCPTWNCNACEVKCPAIPKTMTCGADYCEGKPLSECLCPMKTDEKGCSNWDCDACDVCGPSPRPEVCPGCVEYYGDLSGAERWEKCTCPIKTDENGCRVFDCDSCETIPDDCRKITLDNGIEVIECEKDCLGIPEGAVEKCRESGGKVIEKTDHYGCTFIECEYEVDGKCPSPEEMEERRNACIEQDLEPMIVRKGKCDTIKCRRAEPDERCAEDVEAKKELKEKCKEAGGEIVKHFGDRGCPVTKCIYPGEDCHKDIPPEAYKKCELEEGDLMIKRDSQGCLMFVDCIKRGKEDIEYEEIEKMPSVATLLAIALKLETLKMEFDKLAIKVMAIAEYYEDKGDIVEATRFRKVAGLFSSALDKIEEIKIKFREKARKMTEEDLRELKYDMKYLSEVIMQDALYVILGGEIEIESGGVTEEGYTDCGRDSQCWKEAVRLCEPAVHTSSKPIEGIRARIHGFDDNGDCMIDAQVDGHSMFCKVPNYAIICTDCQDSDILEYCKGSLVKWIKSGQKPGEIEKPKKPGKCVDRCGDKICQEKVCMGNGCPCQESPRSCPIDCEAIPTEFELCTEEDEEAWKVCQDEGGNPQTDPSKYGNCEIYTHCSIPSPETVEECEKYTAPGIKNDCYIKIAERTGDSSVCVKITRPGRKDKCYVKAAETSKDDSICENIVAEGIKKHCYNVVAEGYYKKPKEIIRIPEVEGEIVFTEDFEQGTDNWIFYDAEGSRGVPPWDTIVESGNTVLRGTGHNWVDLDGKEWTNYIFKTRFKIIRGAMHFNYRLHKEGDFRRYYVGVSNDGVYLTRSTPPTHINLIAEKIQLDDNWHDFKMIGYDNILNIYIDDELVIEYKDVGTPALPGGIAFETLGGAEFWIDDIEIQISGKKDIIGGVS